MKNITIIWRGEKEFSIAEAECSQLGPKALMLLSLAKCTGLTALALLEKMRVQITSLQIDASGELTQPDERADSVFTSFNECVSVGCPQEEDHDMVVKAVTMTCEKYCGVGTMLRQVAPVGFEIFINGRRKE